MQIFSTAMISIDTVMRLISTAMISIDTAMRLISTAMISIGTTMRSISTVMMNEEKFIFLLWPNTEHPGNNPVKNIIKKKLI